MQALSKTVMCKLTSHRYTSLRTGRITEELKNTIATSRKDLSVVARQNNGEIDVVRQSLAEPTANDVLPDDPDEETKVGAEAQLSEQKAALELSHHLLAQLQSMLQDDKIGKLAAGRGGNANITFGSITGGFGVGVSNAPISNVSFGSPPTTGPAPS